MNTLPTMDAEREAFEVDAEPMGFDLTRSSAELQRLAPEPWIEYQNFETGHRWGGWLARAATSPQAAPVVVDAQEIRKLRRAVACLNDMVSDRMINHHETAAIDELYGFLRRIEPSPDAVQAPSDASLAAERDAWREIAEKHYGLWREAKYDDKDYPTLGCLDAWASANYSCIKSRYAADAVQAAPAPTPCTGCSGHGMVGGLLPNGGGYDSEECPFCKGSGTEAAPAAVPKWIDDPHDIEQGQMLNPAWLSANGFGSAKEYATSKGPAVQGEALTDERINELRQKHGITSSGRGIKEWENVRAFAREVIAATAPAADAVRPVVAEIVAEVERATKKFPTWPTDPLHAVAVLGEEFGELTKAALQLCYEPHKNSAEEVRTEAMQTAAMSLRFAMSLDRYEYRPGEQHSQSDTKGQP